MSYPEGIPYYPTYRPDAQQSDSVSSQEATRIAPAAYDSQVKEVLAIHTGSPETYLTIDQEQELAANIQDGRNAAATLEELKAKSRLTPEEQSRYNDVLAKFQAGRRAEHTLIECNLRLSRYLALASMNILPAGDQEAVGKQSQAGVRRRALLNDRLPWLPRDFTSLKSHHADLDDRIQVANMALMRAAHTVVPGVTDKNGRILGFISYASPIIKTDLTKYVRGGAPDSHEKPFYFPASIVEGIASAHSEDWQSHLTPEKRAELLRYDQAQDTTPLEKLYFAGAANEELDHDGSEPPLLWAGEIIADDEPIDPFETVADMHRLDQIDWALGTLSAREAGVLRLRYGLADGVQYTLDQIGQVYGVTRERIRQIERQALEKLRHPYRANQLRNLQSVEEGGALPTRSGDIVKTGQTIGSASLRLMMVPAEPKPVVPIQRSRASWQAYPDEAWDEPVRKIPAQIEAEYIKTGERLREIIFGASTYTFQKSFVESVDSPYPKILVDRITQTFGRDLTPHHVADFWNKHLEPFLEHLTDALGDDASLDRATQLLSRLLAERMGDSDTVTLRIAENLQGKLGYVGAWLSHGRVHVLGDVADHAGHQMSGLGHLQVDGSVRHFAGQGMNGNARLEIDGNVGDFLGLGMTGSASILVNGDTGDYCGHRMRSRNALIEVLGNTGDHPGFDTTNGEIKVHGVAGKSKTRYPSNH